MGFIRYIAGGVAGVGIAIGSAALDDTTAENILVGDSIIDMSASEDALGVLSRDGNEVDLRTIINGERVRNPGERAASALSELFNSLGTQDDRRPVRHGEHVYDAVLQMEIDQGVYGTSYCTATIAEFEGFELRLPGTAIATAAHCFDIKNRQTKAIIGRVTDPAAITFTGSYMDGNGEIHTFSMQAESIWVNPLYYENGDEDTAIVYTSALTPAEILPAYVLVPDYLESAALAQEFTRAIADGNTPRITVAGHSGDRDYLTTHEGARVRVEDTDTDTIGSDADFVSGSSGGPVFSYVSVSEPVELRPNGQPVMIAVNQAVYSGAEYGNHSHYDDIVLNSVPFLKPAGTPSDQRCIQIAEIAASSLYMRVGPSTQFNRLSNGDNGGFFAIPAGEIPVLHGTTRNELGEEWGFVSYEDRSGYISLNDDYANVYPPSCISGIAPAMR